MRRFLAVLLVAATPAWAYNDGTPRTQAEWFAVNRLCVSMGGDPHMCSMANAPSEMEAIASADLARHDCDRSPTKEILRCDEIRAYIKQRWGY